MGGGVGNLGATSAVGDALGGNHGADDGRVFRGGVLRDSGGDVDRVALRLTAFAVGLALGGFSAATWAIATPWPKNFGGGVYKIPELTKPVSIEAPYSVWPALSDGAGGAKFQGKQVVKLPGAQATVNLSRAVTLSNLARGARIASGLLGPVALVGLAYEGIVWLNGHWETVGQTVELAQGWRHFGPWSACDSAADGCTSAAAMTAAMNGYFGVGMYRITDVGSPVLEGSGFLMITYAYETLNASGAVTGSGTQQVGRVPIPGESFEAGRLATEGEVETALSNGLAADPSKAPAVLEKIVEAVPPLNLNPEPLQVSGPASVQGATTSSTTINANGTTVDNRTVTYNMTYNGGNVTVTQTTSSTVTHPDNSTSTTTTTTDAGDGGGEETPPDKSDLCKEHPEISACQELGEDQDTPELPHQERTFSMAPEMSAAGSCPSPQALSILGGSYELSWQPLCDLASGVRPVVLALSWLGASMFVFAVGSRAT